jgi:hypothetical protein
MTYGCVTTQTVHCYGAVTDLTAYKDGFVDGWAHWCKTDAKDCDTLPQPH